MFNLKLKNLIIIVSFLIFSLIVLSAQASFAANRKLNYDQVVGDIDIPVSNFTTQEKELRPNKKINFSMEIKDKNEKLYATVGKTQLLKFDDSVKRVSITNPAIADIVIISPREIMLNGKKAGTTSLVFWGTNNLPVFYNLVVQQNSDAFLQAIQELTPNEDINLTFTDEGVVLSGRISSSTVKENIKNLAKAYNFPLIDMSESPTKQVLLEVKIAEASRTFTNTLGTQFIIGQDSGANSSIASFSAAKGLTYTLLNKNAKLNLIIQASEKKGLIKILAEPKLLALNNVKASFNVGNEVPVPSQIGQYGQVSYEFKDTGVILNFTPQILEKSNRVILKLTPEVSEIDNSVAIQQPGGGTIPGFKTRKVDTTVELGDSETLIIAGLLKQTSSNTKDRIPWISNIPIFGFLFQSLSDTKDDTELVIFITPKIIDSNSTDAL